MYAEEDYLMLSGIQHFAFCRRQWAMIHIEQQWAENYRTTSGELMHKKAHDEGSFEKRGDLLIVRGLRISSQELGLSGQCDVVEFEYKRGTPKENNADALQLCAQAICLEEMFQTNISEGFLYYGENRRRSKTEFTDDLRQQVKKYSMEMHDLFHKGYTPNAKPTKQCKACSLEELCIPKLQKVKNVRAYIEQNIHCKD